MSAQIKQTGYSDEPFLIQNNPPEFIVDGYEFICWNTKKDGSGTVINPNEFHNFQNDTTLYAQWKLLYKYMQLIELGDVDVKSNVAIKFNDKSGFRTPMFLNINSSSNFELLLKIKTSSDIKTKQILFRMFNTYKCNICLYNSKIYSDLNGQSSIDTFQVNTTYYIKIIKNGTQISVLSSIDNVNFKNVFNVNTSITVANEYLMIGHSYEYTETYTEYYTVSVAKQKIKEYKTDYVWVTKKGCRYAPSKYTYNDRLKHSTKKHYKSNGKLNSNSCGKWTVESTPVYQTYNENEQRSRQAIRTIAASSFTGQIDFNESYLVFNNIKYKLKV